MKLTMKRMATMILAILMAFATMAPAFASGAVIEPMRYEPCSKCGVGMVSESIVEGERMELERRVCIHHLDGNDVKYKILRTRQWHCGSCGWSFAEEIASITRWECEAH